MGWREMLWDNHTQNATTSAEGRERCEVGGTNPQRSEAPTPAKHKGPARRVTCRPLGGLVAGCGSGAGAGLRAHQLPRTPVRGGSDEAIAHHLIDVAAHCDGAASFGFLNGADAGAQLAGFHRSTNPTKPEAVTRAGAGVHLGAGLGGASLCWLAGGLRGCWLALRLKCWFGLRLCWRRVGIPPSQRILKRLGLATGQIVGVHGRAVWFVPARLALGCEEVPIHAITL